MPLILPPLLQISKVSGSPFVVSALLQWQKLLSQCRTYAVGHVRGYLHNCMFKLKELSVQIGHMQSTGIAKQTGRLSTAGLKIDKRFL